MKRTMAISTAMIVAMMFVVYMYVLIKIIVFKFGPFDIRFLWHQAELNMNGTRQHPSWIGMANLVPLRTIAENLNSGSRYDHIQFFGNIGLFIPLGLFLVYFTRSWKHPVLSFGVALVSSFALTLLLESVQLVSMIGSFDVDDLILNTAGGMFGYLFFLSLARILTPNKPKSALKPQLTEV